jgi:hypothetical protein
MFGKSYADLATGSMHKCLITKYKQERRKLARNLFKGIESFIAISTNRMLSIIDAALVPAFFVMGLAVGLAIVLTAGMDQAS